MKLLIIGHSVVDHIFDGEKENIAPGGIFYSSIGFSAIKKKEDVFYLLTSTSATDAKFFESAFSNFNLEYANKLDSIPHVNLYVDGAAERREHYQNSAPPLKITDEIQFENFSGIYINMITGNDFAPNQFIELRKNYNGMIYLDVHTLSRGIGKDQHRFFRKIPEYEKYLNNVDIIQVNDLELKTITQYDNKDQIIEEVFKHNVKILIITKGERGAEVYSRDGKYFTVDGLKINSINKIGCGDVFGSVFFYSYLSENNLGKALVLANKAAGMVTSYSSEEQLINLKNDLI